MEHHPIEKLMQTTLENIKEMVDVNTVVGEPIPAGNGATVIPISRVSFGFVAGGGDYETGKAHLESALAQTPFAGGSGAGVSVQPVGFLVVSESGVHMLPAQNTTLLERAVNCLPQVLEDVKSILPGCDSKKDGYTG